MANVGDRCKVNSNAPDTGRYKHSACTNTEIFNKGNNLAPCANFTCPNKSADWILQQKLT
jgi:hypothetical protein